MLSAHARAQPGRHRPALSGIVSILDRTVPSHGNTWQLTAWTVGSATLSEVVFGGGQRWIPGGWFSDDSGTGVSPVCRLHDSHGRDARATTAAAIREAIFRKACFPHRTP